MIIIPMKKKTVKLSNTHREDEPKKEKKPEAINYDYYHATHTI